MAVSGAVGREGIIDGKTIKKRVWEKRGIECQKK